MSGPCLPADSVALEARKVAQTETGPQQAEPSGPPWRPWDEAEAAADGV
ncbi:hypothetical protein ACFRCI_18235 [Streptomyces sp. NPDC056638]